MRHADVRHSGMASSQLNLGPIPRPAFSDFLRKGFESAGATIAAGAIEHILDVGEDVPYNVQQLARALEALERQHFLRQDLAGITPTWRFEDPFMRAWLATLENQ
jgi:hypothetical protein